VTRCKYCGGPVGWKDEAGWYRDFCETCADRVSPPDPEDLQATYDPDGEPTEEDADA